MYNAEIYKYPTHKPSINHNPYDYPAIHSRVVKKDEEYIEDLFIDYKKLSSSQRDDIKNMNLIAILDNKYESEYNERFITKNNITPIIKLAITNTCVTMNNNAKYSKANIKCKYTIYNDIYCIIFMNNNNKIVDLEIPIINTINIGSSEPAIKFIS